MTPATRYFYAVGSSAGPLAGGDASHFFATSPPAGLRAPTRVWVLGDSGTAGRRPRGARRLLRFTGPRHTDVWLMLGDNAYNDGLDTEYQTAVFEKFDAMLRKSVLWPTLGNHDGHSANSATQTGPYYDIFTLPTAGEAGGVPSGTEAYYSFDRGNIHFVCLDSYLLPSGPRQPDAHLARRGPRRDASRSGSSRSGITRRTRRGRTTRTPRPS